MSAIIKKNVVYANGGSSSGDAKDIKYDNTNSDLESSNVQDAIDEINGIEMTQEEYDALSEEEKMSGTYWIIDSGSGNGGTTIEVVDSLDSTDIDKALSANMGRQLKEDIDSIGDCELIWGDPNTPNTNSITSSINLAFNKDISEYKDLLFIISYRNDGFNGIPVRVPVSLFKKGLTAHGSFSVGSNYIWLAFTYLSNTAFAAIGGNGGTYQSYLRAVYGIK